MVLLNIYILEMGGLTETPTFSVSSSHRQTALNFFYETEIVRFSAITTEWLYPRKHCWNRLSDFNKIKFHQHLYHCNRKRLNTNMIKIFNLLVIGNKCEIYLFTKEMKKKKITTDMTLGWIYFFFITECFQREKKGK